MAMELKRFGITWEKGAVSIFSLLIETVLAVFILQVVFLKECNAQEYRSRVKATVCST